jgi:hypothetical protein
MSIDDPSVSQRIIRVWSRNVVDGAGSQSAAASREELS